MITGPNDFTRLLEYQPYSEITKVKIPTQATPETNKEFSGITYCARLRDGKDQRRSPTSATDWDDVRLP